MNYSIDRVKSIQRIICPKEIDPDKFADGIWGSASISACHAYLRSIAPKPNPFPSAEIGEFKSVFGDPGDESNLAFFEFPLPAYYDGKLVTRGRVHKKLVDSLESVLLEIKNSGIEKIDYAGCYNFRPNRNAPSRFSLHAWGCAIDINADSNSNLSSWPIHADMDFRIICAFARHGWTSGGAMWGKDAMHFQSTKF